MVPNVAKTGTSFQGAGLYYLHDKKREGETERLSDERVAWTDVRNMPTDDPELGLRIMAATAMDQQRLKMEAGIKATGRKSANSVYAYSLAWHPDEHGKIDRAEMMKAVDASLKAIGAQDHQAIVIAHRDEPHPHVHVVVNRVSPEDGRMLSKSNDWKKLDAWALAYRQERGEQDRYCPLRQEKADAIARRKAGERDVPYISAKAPRTVFQKVAANDNEARKMLAEQKGLDAALFRQSEGMRQRHSNEWTMLSQRYSAGKAQVKARYAGRGAASPFAQARATVRKQFKPAWSDLSRRQFMERREFAKRDKSLGGKISNALAAVRLAEQLEPESTRGVAAKLFNFLLSRDARVTQLDKIHAAEKRELRRMERSAGDEAVQVIRNQQAADHNAHRQGFARDRQVLIDRQAAEKAAMQRQWAQRKVERDRVKAILQTKETYRREAEGLERPGESPKSRGRKSTEFNREDRKQRKRKPRSRGRIRRRTRGDD